MIEFCWIKYTQTHIIICVSGGCEMFCIQIHIDLNVWNELPKCSFDNVIKDLVNKKHIIDTIPEARIFEVFIPYELFIDLIGFSDKVESAC